MPRSLAVIPLLFILLLAVTGCNKEASMQAEIEKQANEVGAAFVAQKYDLILEHIYPPLVEKAGGKDKMMAIWQEGMASMKAKGITLVSVKIGKPGKIVTAGTELHSLVPQTIIMDLPGKQLTSESNLIAVSQDKGKKWYFIDNAPLNNENIKQVLPNFNSEIVIPEKKQPVVVDK
jgi:hypothetical protein